MPTKRYKSTRRYKLSTMTVDRMNELLEKHNEVTSNVAAELGVSVTAVNDWIRKNNCKWRLVACDENCEDKEGSDAHSNDNVS